MEQKLFSVVFEKLNLSANVKAVLKECYVDSINLFTKDKTLTILLSSPKVLNEECLKDFKEDLQENFFGLEDIKISLKYNLNNTCNFEKIKSIWQNILNFVKESSIICFNILNNSTFEVEDEIININLAAFSKFVFKAKKIDSLISQILKERFDINFKINFNDPAKPSFIISNKREIPRRIENNQYNNQNSNQNNNAKIDIQNTNYKAKKTKRSKGFKLNIKEEILEEAVCIKNNILEGETIVIKGVIFNHTIIETKDGKLIMKADITDNTYALSFKFFIGKEELEKYKSTMKDGNYVKLKGIIQYDDYTKELILIPKEIANEEPPEIRQDLAKEKRVELHLHTQMSKMDAVSSVKSLLERAAKWGHKAIAITDHAGLQAYPDAMDVSKKLGIKVIYGLEAYLVDDLNDIAQNVKGQNILDEYVVFDIETTGLNREINKIIEIGAVKIKDGKIIDKFSSFVNPNEKLSDEIINLTKITDDMLLGAEEENTVLPKFFEFFKDSVLVAHNAEFDIGFIKKWAERNNKTLENTVLDTLGLSRAIFPEMTKHTLNVIAKKLNISLENHHRAVDDANATAEIFIKFINILKDEYNINNLEQINKLARTNIDVKKLRPHHAVILVKNQVGLKNLYKLVSKSNLEYFFRDPRIPKSEFLQHREGLLIGTACSSGEFYDAVLNNASKEKIEKLANFYDYFEIQPVLNNEFLIKNEKVSNVNSIEDLQNINKQILEYGKQYNKLVVATGDVHFLDEEDSYFRKIILHSKGYKDYESQPPLYFKTTDEMLKEFEYLGKEDAYDVVIKNTNLILDMIGDVLPIPEGTYPPVIEGADEELKNITISRAKQIYGEDLPRIVKTRLERELDSIIKNGFAVLYIIAQKVVWFSNQNGYIVGSRGSVGSSFVATMAGITEVNPLSPHYICKNCKYSDFESEIVLKCAGNSGWDLPDMDCPKCGCRLYKDGHDIPFETFLGFEGDKEPDIDLNFSGEFQAKAHQYTEELFGKDNVFKAGTIGTLADKTAYIFAKKYAEENNIKMNNAELSRLALGCVGIKRTTGQHPGGLMVVPKYKEIYDFCPIQRPADDPKSDIITTHFDYHSISGRILKLDLLGHDVPTILKMLKDFTNFDPLDAPMDDKETMSLFVSPKALNLTEEDIECKTGTLGLPEFGTPFVIQMLIDTKPNSFSDLIKISGLSHGTDVWFNNAQDLIKNNIATLKEVIPTRDDIMVYLILKGLENKLAFTIMESVRKGKGLTKEFEEIMLSKNVPIWYIESCKKIKYMFPKGHAVAYVTNAFRMGYFKINYPYAFYAAILSVKIEEFDYDKMCFGLAPVEEEIKEIQKIGKKATTKEKNKLVILEIVREFYKRGLKFVEMDLYKAKGFKFTLLEDGLMPPLCTVQGLGENATKSIVEARKDGAFDTIEVLIERTKITKTVVELLKKNGVLKGIPDTNQLTLF